MFTLPEALLIIGTFGICLGVWVTLTVIIKANRENSKLMEVAPMPTSVEVAPMTTSGCDCGGNCKCGKKG